MPTKAVNSRKELQRIWALAKKLVPDAKETVMYGMPTLKYRDKPFLGILAHKNHLGIYPYSGRILPQLKSELRDYKYSSGALRVAWDKPMPATLLKRIIRLRLAAIRAESRRIDLKERLSR